MRKYRFLFFTAIILTASLFLNGCAEMGEILDDIEDEFASTKKPDGGSGSQTLPAGRTGTISAGPSSPVVSSSIGTGGGTIVVTDPTGQLTGMEITVPAGSFGRAIEFNISSGPVENHSFGEDFNPVSPLITVDNGEIFSEELIEVKIPITVPEGHFAMGFLYDRETGRLEGLPLVARDDDSITIGTRHFSNIIITAIEVNLLLNDVDSGFRPGVDDWQFTNRGSYLAPGGHCSGQSMTAMWYYVNKPDGKNATLYGRYDNNGQEPASPDFWRDDSRGYRFASVIQSEADYDSILFKFSSVLGFIPEDTWRLFAYSIQLTGEPQMVGIIDTKEGGGHAMVVYRISGGNLYVADPNYPGNSGRVIEYSGGKFKPYPSGSTADEIEAGRGKSYNSIFYVPKTSFNDWGKIAEHWREVKKGTIGDGFFPVYQMYRIDDEGNSRKLEDSFVSEDRKLKLSIESSLGSKAVFVVARDLNILRPESVAPGIAAFELEPGTNNLQFLINGTDANGKQQYIDFKYFEVIYEETEQEDWNLAETYNNAEGRDPEFYTGRARDKGSYDRGSVDMNAGTITFQRHKVINDEVTEDYKIEAQFEAPPEKLVPGQTIELDLSLKITAGTLSSGTHSFALYAISHKGDETIVLGSEYYTTVEIGRDNLNPSATIIFTVPEDHDGTLEIGAVFNAARASLIWTYGSGEINQGAFSESDFKED